MRIRLNNLRLRHKMLLVYFLCVFIPIMLTNVIFYNTVAGNVREGRIKDIDLAVGQVRNDLGEFLDDAVGLSSFYYADYRTNEILDRDFADSADYVAAYDDYLRRVLNHYNPPSFTLQNIMIYVNNETLLDSGNVGYLSERVASSEWYRRATASARSHPVFMRTYAEDGRFAGFSLLRKMDYFGDRMSKEKVMKIDFKTIDFSEIFSNLNMQGELYLLNPDGNIEFTTDPALDWRNGESVAYASLPLKNAIEFVKDFGGVGYLQGWRIAGTIDEVEVVREVGKSRASILWSACIMMIVPTLIIAVITRSINVRIVQILKHMKKVKNGKFVEIAGTGSADEIGQLKMEFNRMTMQIQSLINDVYLAEIQKKSLELERRKAQMNALQSQINPHFLFNALETIRMRSVLKNEGETAKIIHSMAKIFRSSLTWNKDRVKVKEELEFIRCFLDIQQYRFEDKLSCRIEVADDAYECEVPKLMFLPFVENACIHGLEPMKRGGTVEITIARTNGKLAFTVRDNGIGMKEEEIARVYGYLEQDGAMGERIGIQNVLYRAKMIYGERLGFTLRSIPGHGTAVHLTVPDRIGQADAAAVAGEADL